jgi:hypothetical protein
MQLYGSNWFRPDHSHVLQVCHGLRALWRVSLFFCRRNARIFSTRETQVNRNGPFMMETHDIQALITEQAIEARIVSKHLRLCKGQLYLFESLSSVCC